MKEIYQKITELFSLVEKEQYIRTLSIAKNNTITLVFDGNHFYEAQEVKNLLFDAGIKVYFFDFDIRTNTYLAKFNY